MIREYLCPPQGLAQKWILRLRVDDEMMAWFKQARRRFQAAQDDSGDACYEMRYVGRAVWRAADFVELSDEADEELLESLYDDRSNVLLGGPLREEDIVARCDVLDYPIGVDVKASGVALDARWQYVAFIRWVELGIEEDLKRCRYNDCAEDHPVAGENELVTCRTCREELCLPEREEE